MASNSSARGLESPSSGGGGIRTHGPGLPVTGFQDQRIQPLCHPSWAPRRRWPGLFRTRGPNGSPAARAGDLGLAGMSEEIRRRWRNWSGEQRCRPLRIARPRTREGLILALIEANEAERRIKVAGSGHSFTGAALTDGTMVQVDLLDRILELDRPSGLVKVEAGIGLGELNRRLDQRGLALESLGDIDRQTLAGSISTATHGTGKRFRNLSSQVVSMELVGADGTLRELSESSDPEGWRAARVGIGALGAIYSVTLQTVTNFRIDRTDRARPLADVLAGLDGFVDELDHFEFYVFPHTETALCRESMRTQVPARPAEPGGDLRAGGRARELDRRRLRAGRPPRAGGDPDALEDGRRRDREGPEDRPELPGLRLRAAGQVHRDGVRDSPRRRPRGGRARPRDRRPAGVRGLLPDRGQVRGRRRRVAQPRPRARQLLHRRPPRSPWRLAALLRGGRCGDGLLRRSPALGQASQARRRGAVPALPALRRFQGDPRPSRSRRQVRQPLHRAGPRPGGLPSKRRRER